MSRPGISFFSFFFIAYFSLLFLWSLESHQCQKWHAYQYILDCTSLLPVTLHALLQLYRSIVSAFIARWLTKSPHSTRLLRERDTMTVCVSPDRSPIWRTITPSSISLITLLCSQKLQKSSGRSSEGMRSGARNDWMISEDLMSSDCSVICRHIQGEILFSIPDTELKGG